MVLLTDTEGPPNTLPNGLRECPRATLAGGGARTVLMGAPVAFLSLHRLGKVDLLFSEVREVAVGWGGASHGEISLVL